MSHRGSGITPNSSFIRAQLDEIIDRFEDAWERGAQPNISAYLPDDAALRQAVLVELVHIDLERRVKKGDTSLIESYLHEFDELADDQTVVMSLIEAEFRLRSKHEPKLSLDEYRRRFPQLEGRLYEQLGGRDSTYKEPEEGAAHPPTGEVAPRASGRYRPLRFHARGGLGEVLVAADDELHREVALKRIQPRHADDAGLRQRFLREAEITSKLQHPGVVPIYGLTHDLDGRPSYAMRFIEGEPMSDAIKRFHSSTASTWGGLDFRNLLKRFVDVCQTVAYAHSRKVIHRDLKPQNIMLGQYGETLVVDWGLAKELDQRDPQPPCGQPLGADTLAGQVMGTPAYMSPEQAAGAVEQVGSGTDIYALGAILYELLTGRRPYLAADSRAVIEQVLAGPPPAPSDVRRDVPRAVEAICLKAMARESSGRYAGAADVARDIDRWLADEPVTGYTEPWTVRTGRWVRRHRTGVVGLGAALLVATFCLSIAVVLLKAAKDRETDAKNTAVEEKKRAEKNLDLAVYGVEKFLVLVSQSQELTEHGLEGLRASLLQSALPFFDEFVGQRRDDPNLEAERGKAIGRLADILTSTGLTPKALEYYGLAQTIFRRLIDEHPDVGDFQSHLADAHTNMGALYQRRGDLGNARSQHEFACQLRRNLVGRFPAIPNYEAVLAESYYNLGLISQAEKKLDDAEKLCLDASAILDRLADAHSAPRFKNAAAGVHYNLGYIYQITSRLERAEKSYERSLRLRKHLIEQFPNDPDFLRSLASTYHNMATLYAGMSNSVETDKCFQEAIKIQERLASLHPKVLGFANWLGSSYFNYGTHVMDTGAIKESLEWFDRALACLGRVLEQESDNAVAKEYTERSLPSRALARMKLGQHMEALPDWDRALQMNRGENRDEIRMMRAATLAKLGDHQKAAVEAKAMLTAGNKDWGVLSGAAGVLAACAGAAQADGKLSDLERKARSDEYAVAAVNAIRDAVRRGYPHRDSIVRDVDLLPIMAHPEFKKFVAELKKEQDK